MLRRLLSLILLTAILVSCLPFAIAQSTSEDMNTAFGDSFVMLDTEDITASEIQSADNSEAEETYAHEEVVDGFVELKIGDSDQEDSSSVLMLQTRLNEIGYLTKAPDGIFGEDTEIAVAEFQTNNGLDRTGMADNKTLSLLYGGGEIVPPAEVNTESDIYRTQRLLSEWGFLADEPDGRKGTNTSEAIIRFKEFLHDGYYKRNPVPTPEPTATPEPTVSSGFGDAEIVEDVLLHPEEEFTDTIDLEVKNFIDGYYSFNPFKESLASGDKSEEVRRVQNRLHQLNYLAVVDGVFANATTRALLYFQKKNDLPQSGVADEETQQLLFSDAALATEEYVNPYKIYVDISDQRVYVFQWDGNGYGIPLKKFICSTGKKGRETETPIGTFTALGPSGTGEWYFFKKFRCYAKWGYFIVGGIMFHSVTYNMEKKLIEGSRRNLGHRASHGCIRLEIENAKWIYDNCPSGTTVVIQE